MHFINLKSCQSNKDRQFENPPWKETFFSLSFSSSNFPGSDSVENVFSSFFSIGKDLGEFLFLLLWIQYKNATNKSGWLVWRALGQGQSMSIVLTLMAFRWCAGSSEIRPFSG